ncbi:MAG: Cys-tRNA(Pro) deacylase [Gemmatimonadaceae bacterium]
MTPAILAARKAGISHEVLEYAHDPAAVSFGLEAAELLGLNAPQVFKTLVADAEGVGLVCALVPVTGTLDLKALAEAVGARKARMADIAAAERATGYVVGGISPLGQRKALKTVIDASALGYETIYVSAGRRGLELALAPMDLVKLANAKTGKIARM